ncbi:MAG TPA: protoporphyrinogen oxidase [Acidimicrobiales bacterium]|nr:protoporphyrinogen oxidase [Acidimicrobiales bacterium]
MARFAVLGAGIAGLSAAWELERAGHDVVVHEQRRWIGGKLRSSPVPGLPFPLDEGADAFLARVPDALELCAELGIDDLVHPATGSAHVWSDGALRPLPKGQLLGLPTDLDELAASGLVSPDGIERARADLESEAPPLDHDISVGRLVRARLGDEVCDHLVEPLLGGINGGEADGLSVEACAPQIWACATRGGSLIRAAADVRAATVDSTAPVFATPSEGMAALPRRLTDALRAEIRFGASPTIQPGRDHVEVDGERYDGVVLAVPAPEVADLLRPWAGDAVAVLDGTALASVVMVTVVAERDSVKHPLDGSGVVVARDAGLDITAASFASTKWAHWDDGEHAVFRISLGHDADPVDWCAKGDDDLTATAVRDLSTVLGEPVIPVGVRVGRWADAFPQYRPGHLGRVADVRAALHAAGPVAVAGMSFDGIGVPACIRSGRAAARHLLG